MLAKKLIEVAMPIKEISAESVRDKSIRHGHISTLHLWWARRPLPVSRAVVFASLVPDPLDTDCPSAFVEAVAQELASPLYKPYADIPYTSGEDPMDDNPRNRLLMFIGKFSSGYVANMKQGKSTPANALLADESLIKWDNKNNPDIIKLARRLIYIAHNASQRPNATYIELKAEFETFTDAIKSAEAAYYHCPDRHLDGPEAQLLKALLDNALDDFLDKMPNVFDPFAGGGAIPLEAARLGCRTFGNDINPVAHIIQRASLQFPQQFGKPIKYTNAEFFAKYGPDAKLESETERNAPFISIANRLAYDVEHYAQKLLSATRDAIGHYYPAAPDGKTAIAYYWARVGTCSNPSCGAKVPLLKSFYLADTSNKQVYLKPHIDGTNISFSIEKGKYKENEFGTWMARGNMYCPCCNNTTDVKTLKQQFLSGATTEELLAVITEGDNGKEYRAPYEAEKTILHSLPPTIDKPMENMPVEYTQALPSCTWGLSVWGDMFTQRQLLLLNTLIEKLDDIKKELKADTDEYGRGVVTYLSFIIDKCADYNSSFCTWHPGREVIGHVFTKQAIPMVFDFPEVYPFSYSSGGIHNMIDWITRYIKGESTHPFWVRLNNASSGDKDQFAPKYLDAVVTDPPYYDAIAYADLSDFFYVWLKRSLGDIYPLNFITPQTPKAQECTALKHHHSDKEAAKKHFENKLLQIFAAIERQTKGVVSIMFAHQSTEAWTTLCNSILGANMNITGSWAVDTEMANRSIGLAGAALASSVTVSCRPSLRGEVGSYKEVRKAVEATVEREVGELYKLGFRGADLLTACFGKAVSEFGLFEFVEKADGTPVSVADLLELARDTAFNALLRGFDGDDQTKFYIGWLQLYGFEETDFDDVAKFTKVGLSINVADLFAANLLIKNGNRQALATADARLKLQKNLGDEPNATLIDQLHKIYAIYNHRDSVLAFMQRQQIDAGHNIWRVATALDELLDKNTPDGKTNASLLTNKDTLLREVRTFNPTKPATKADAGPTLFD